MLQMVEPCTVCASLTVATCCRWWSPVLSVLHWQWQHVADGGALYCLCFTESGNMLQMVEPCTVCASLTVATCCIWWSPVMSVLHWQWQHVADGGALYCLYFTTDSGNTYLTVYNRDSNPDGSTYYRFSCLVSSKSSSTRTEHTVNAPLLSPTRLRRSHVKPGTKFSTAIISCHSASAFRLPSQGLIYCWQSWGCDGRSEVTASDIHTSFSCRKPRSCPGQLRIGQSLRVNNNNNNNIKRF